MDYQEDLLWQRISNFNLDAADVTRPFSKKLAGENQWTENYTARAIAEYKRFVYLCCISPTGAAPSPIVDEVWHMHLTYTVNYWQDFCKNILQRELHHYPAEGGTEDEEKHQQWYLQTIQLYRKTFGSRPPKDIWKRPTNHHDIPKVDPQHKKNVLAFILATVFGLIILAASSSIFAGAYVFVLVMIVVASNNQNSNKKRKNNGGNCGGGCTSCSSCSGSSCSSCSGCGGCGGGD